MNIYLIGQKGLPAKGGGIERHVEELSAKLAAEGHTVFAYARQGYTKSDLDQFRGVQILYTPAIYTKHLEAITHTFFSIMDLMRRKQVDVIHVHGIGPSLLIPLIRVIKPGTRVVSTIHCADYNHQKWGAVAKFALRMGEKVAAKCSHKAITVSCTLRDQVKSSHGVHPVYIPNGVDLFNDSADPARLKQWGLEPNSYIVAISRLIRHKGLHLLIEAYKQIDTDKKLVIVGGSEYTDDYVEELYALAENNPNIIFTGKQYGQDLQALFEHAYLFVHPSMSEGLSIALLEALSYRQAVLISDIPENMEVAKDLGFVFKSGNVSDLASKLQFAVSHPELTKQKKELGRAHVEKNYNWNQIAKDTVNLYRELLEPDAIPTPKKAKNLQRSII